MATRVSCVVSKKALTANLVRNSEQLTRVSLLLFDAFLHMIAIWLDVTEINNLVDCLQLIIFLNYKVLNASLLHF